MNMSIRQFDGPLRLMAFLIASAMAVCLSMGALIGVIW